MIIYHGGTEIVESPRVIVSDVGRDFGFGFYTTDIKAQAIKWANRQARLRKSEAVLNVYNLDDSALQALNVLRFEDYGMDWLDFVVNNRKNNGFAHDYDIVIGKIADDDVGETVQTVINGLAPKEYALERLKFMPANNQICFCTETVFKYLRFLSAERVQ